jgi:tRNA(Ile)-lysidine synthase TilS/MesJ
MSLLHILLEFQKKLPIRFDIEVCTIDPMTPSFDPSALVPYVESLGLKHHYIRDEIVERAMSSGKDGTVVKSLCAFCARMKRGNLYSCARKNNCNKLVLAQHVSFRGCLLLSDRCKGASTHSPVLFSPNSVSAG